MDNKEAFFAQLLIILLNSVKLIVKTFWELDFETITRTEIVSLSKNSNCTCTETKKKN